MKIFLDTASAAEIQWGSEAGLIDGVMTSHALLAREAEAEEHRAHVGQLCRVTDGPVHVEVVAVDAEGMYREGKEWAKVADNVVVKVPMIEEAILAVRRLATEGVRVNTTLVFNAAQALLASKAGAAYVSPYLGRLDDIGQAGATVVGDIRKIFDNFAIETEILAASVRNPMHFIDAAKLGADGATVPTSVLRALLLHPLTDRGLDQFLSDWSRGLAKSRVGAPT